MDRRGMFVRKSDVPFCDYTFTCGEVRRPRVLVDTTAGVSNTDLDFGGDWL